MFKLIKILKFTRFVAKEFLALKRLSVVGRASLNITNKCPKKGARKRHHSMFQVSTTRSTSATGKSVTTRNNVCLEPASRRFSAESEAIDAILLINACSEAFAP
jgi:hypothetical protein